MFDTYKLNEKGFSDIKKLKSAMSVACELALSLMPEGHEKKVFLLKLEEAMFFGTKAVSRKIGNYSEIVHYEKFSG